MNGQESFGGEGLGDAADRVARRIERAMDRVAESVERGVENFERKVEEALYGHHESTASGEGAGQAGGPSPGGGGTSGPAGDPGPGEAGGKGFGARMADGYSGIVEKARVGVTKAVSRGADAFDGAAGDVPWRMAGLDPRGTRIAREIVREVVPKVAGERVASMMDGAAMKGGIAGAGLLLRIPLKGFAVPFLLGVTAVESVKAVKDVRRSVADIAARVDNEARSAEAYREESTGA